MDEDGGLGCIGSMFDTAASRHVINVTLPRASDEEICITVRCINGEPGHVQSGQYIWPAAESLCRYLSAHWTTLSSRTVIELGAGCGMAGIAAAKLGGSSTYVIFTDHDPGAVNLLEENAELNDIAARSLALQLEWGAPLPTELIDRLKNSSGSLEESGSVLIIGSDLLYCAGVVRPLMDTVAAIVKHHSCVNGSNEIGTFVLVSSFDTGDDVEAEMALVSREMGFQVNEINKLDVASSCCRTQLFTFFRKSEDAVVEKVGFAVDKDIYAARYSHMDFFSHRDFSAVPKFWLSVLHAAAEDLPTCITGASPYRLTNLADIHESGACEYSSDDPRFRRRTFALRVGYVGTEFMGFQDQKGAGVITVEGELKSSLGENFPCAGRTDKNVSALSQVISFHTFDSSVSTSSIMDKFRSSPAYEKGHVRVLDCWRVPRAFNALFSATWRRYIYMFPLNVKTDSGRISEKANDSRSKGINFGWFPVAIDSSVYHVDVNVSVVDKLLRRLEGRELPYDAFAYREKRGEGADLCTLLQARATAVDVSRWAPHSESGASTIFMAVELVGNRFLRKMVRILTATAIRASFDSVETTPLDMDVAGNHLVDIALSGDRLLASAPLPGEGLCMCGVGYDLLNSKVENNIRSVYPSICGTGSIRKQRKKRARQEASTDSITTITSATLIPPSENS